MTGLLLGQWEMLKLIPRKPKTTVKGLQDKLEANCYTVRIRTLKSGLDRLYIPFAIYADA
jgi:hypothetical protein